MNPYHSFLIHSTLNTPIPRASAKYILTMDQKAVTAPSARGTRKQRTPKAAQASRLTRDTPTAYMRSHTNPLDCGRRKRQRNSTSCGLEELATDAISTSLERTIANLNANQDLRAFAVAIAGIVDELQDLLPQYKCKAENCD